MPSLGHGTTSRRKYISMTYIRDGVPSIVPVVDLDASCAGRDLQGDFSLWKKNKLVSRNNQSNLGLAADAPPGIPITET